MKQPVFRLVATLIVVLGTTLACTGTPSDPGPEYPTSVVPSDGVPPPSSQVLSMRLPLDTYLLSVDEIYVIETATDLLERQCMARAGLAWPLIAHPRFGDWRNRRRYGVIEPAVARAFGYHAVPALLSPVAVYNEKVLRYNALSPAQRVAATTPVTGCEAVAVTEIRSGIADTDESAANQLSRRSLDTSAGRPEVRQAFAAWSACMAASGYRYPSPSAAASDRTWAATENASSAEIAVAETDVGCQQRTGVIDTWYRAEVDTQNVLIAADPTYFSGLARSKDDLLTAAQRVITGS